MPFSGSQVTRLDLLGLPGRNYGAFTRPAAAVVVTPINPFPLSIREWRLDLNEARAITESLFTRRRQVLGLAGGTSDRWEGLFTTPPLTAANITVMMNWLLDVGIYGQFSITPPDYSGPASGESDGLVAGVGQSGSSLTCDGFSANTLILSEGEYFQIGTELKRVTANATSSSIGEVTFSFKPPMRHIPDDGAAVVLNTPYLLAELTSAPEEEVDFTRISAFTVSFRESLVSEG